MVVALVLSGCGPLSRSDADAQAAGGVINLRFEDVAAPSVFRREGMSRRAGPDAAPGLWAVLTDLPRPERAEIVHLRSGSRVRVALFAGGTAGTVGLSRAAAEALGIGAEPAPVRVTALRRVPRITAGRGR